MHLTPTLVEYKAYLDSLVILLMKGYTFDEIEVVTCMHCYRTWAAKRALDYPHDCPAQGNSTTFTSGPSARMGDDNLTIDKLRATLASFTSLPKMPRWKDLTWAQRQMVEREIDTTENLIVRGAMRDAYYCEDDDCPYHGTKC